LRATKSRMGSCEVAIGGWDAITKRRGLHARARESARAEALARADPRARVFIMEA